MPNGKDYILFYLKLLLESIDHEGTLRFSETIPYNEQMLSVVTNTNIDTVRSAMKLFVELNMMSICDDQTIYMNEVEKLIGSETNWARQKREQRLAVDNVHQLSTSCPPEIEKDKEIDKDTDTELDVEVDSATTATEDNQLKCIGGNLGKGVVYLTDRQFADLMDRLGLDAFNRYVDRLATFIIDKNAHVKSHYETILKWVEQDSKVSKASAKRPKHSDFNSSDALSQALERTYGNNN